MRQRCLLVTLLMLIVFLLFFAGCGDDGTVIVPNPTVTPFPTAGIDVSVINGVVYGRDSLPVSGARLVLTPVISGSMEGSESYGETQTGVSDSEGIYTFTVSFSGTYLIEARTADGSELLGSQEFVISLGESLILHSVMFLPPLRHRLVFLFRFLPVFRRNIREL